MATIKSIEEKARLYDEAIRKAKDMLSYKEIRQEDIEYLFPELKESNDVVKCLINGMKFYYEDNEEATWGTEKFSMKVKDILSWLEKQAEHAKFRDSIQVGDKVTRNQDGVLVNLSQLKRVAKPAEVQGEKKPVEPQQDMLSQEKYAKAVDECIYGEQKPAAWSEEDEYCIHQLIVFCENCMVQDDGAKRCAKWLKSLRPQKQDVMSEDVFEHVVGCLVQDIVANEHMPEGGKQPTRVFVEKYYNKLRPQSTWKPSDKQIKVCKEVYADLLSAKGFDLGTINSELNRMEQQLKKLREE